MSDESPYRPIRITIPDDHPIASGEAEAALVSGRHLLALDFAAGTMCVVVLDDGKIRKVTDAFFDPDLIEKR